MQVLMISPSDSKQFNKSILHSIVIILVIGHLEELIIVIKLGSFNILLSSLVSVQASTYMEFKMKIK